MEDHATKNTNLQSQFDIRGAGWESVMPVKIPAAMILIRGEDSTRVSRLAGRGGLKRLARQGSSNNP
jgi:hypothetical protein